VDIVFDELTGLASAAGFALFHLSVETGDLQIAPEEGLSQLLDSMQSACHRGRFEVSCTIMGHFEWQVGVPVPPVHGKVTMYIQDSTCWQETQMPSALVLQSLSGLSAGECRQACRSDVRCGAYTTQQKACLFLSPCGPNPVGGCRSFQAAVKITNCSVERTCLNLTGSNPVWLYTGIFCPVAFERTAEASNSWVFRKTVATPQDVFYLAPDTGSLATCSNGLWLTRPASWEKDMGKNKPCEIFRVAGVASVSGLTAV
jgi:hypothetical protein